jgi:hypothetical protein
MIKEISDKFLKMKKIKTLLIKQRQIPRRRDQEYTRFKAPNIAHSPSQPLKKNNSSGGSRAGRNKFNPVTHDLINFSRPKILKIAIFLALIALSTAQK